MLRRTVLQQGRHCICLSRRIGEYESWETGCEAAGLSIRCRPIVVVQCLQQRHGTLFCAINNLDTLHI